MYSFSYEDIGLCSFNSLDLWRKSSSVENDSDFMDEESLFHVFIFHCDPLLSSVLVDGGGYKTSLKSRNRLQEGDFD